MKYNQIEDLSTISFNKTRDILNLIGEHYNLNIEQKSYYRQKLISFFSKYILEDNIVSMDFLISNIDENFKDLFNENISIKDLDFKIEDFLKRYPIRTNELYTSTSTTNLNVTVKQIFETLKNYIIYTLKNNEINFDNFDHNKYDFDYIYKGDTNKIKLSKEARKYNRDFFISKSTLFIQLNYDEIF